MKKVIVTGADGSIGSALVKSLLSNGYQVYAVAKDKDHDFGLIDPGIEMIPCSFSEYHSLSALVDGPVDCFIHLAWGGWPSPCAGRAPRSSVWSPEPAGPPDPPSPSRLPTDLPDR